LIIFPCKKHKIIRGSSLKFFIGYGFKMLSIVFSNTGIISTDDNVPGFFYS
jgi:hypothetical protein